MQDRTEEYIYNGYNLGHLTPNQSQPQARYILRPNSHVRILTECDNYFSNRKKLDVCVYLMSAVAIQMEVRYNQFHHFIMTIFLPSIVRDYKCKTTEVIMLGNKVRLREEPLPQIGIHYGIYCATLSAFMSNGHPDWTYHII